MQSAVTISLVPEAKGGPFVFWGDLEQSCATAAKLGFTAVEVFPRSAEELNARDVRNALARHNLQLAAMGTGAGWVVQKLRLTDPDANVRQRARAFVASVIDLASSFGAAAILGSMQGRFEGTVTREQAIAWLGEALEELGSRAHAAGVPLFFEPLNRYETNLINTVADGIELLRPLRSKNIKLLCDLFHMNIEEASIPDALRRAGPLVGHVHFADSNRQAVGFGHTEMRSVIRALRDLNYQGYLSAEVLPLPDSLGAATQTIQALNLLTRGN